MKSDKSSSAWSETRVVAKTSGPLTAAYAADILMYLTDMAIVGRVGVSELAGVAQAEQVVFLVIAVLGTLISFSSVATANAIGAHEPTRAVHAVHQGILIAIMVSIPATLLARNIDFFLGLAAVDGEVVSHAGTYVRAVSWCILPYLIFMLLRAFLVVLDRPKAVLVTTISAVLLNAILSYSLTFGAFGMPKFGVAGAGMATSMVTVAMVIALTWSIFRSPPLPGVSFFRVKLTVDLALWSKIFRKGIPAALSALMEDGLFVVAGILIGTFGGVALAAHYVVNSIVNIAIVFANGIGDATSLRVAIHRGGGNLGVTRLAGYSGVALCVSVMLLFSLAMVFVPDLLSSVFVDSGQPDSSEVFAMAAQLFLIAAFSQIVEGIQIVTMRALRGLEDTIVPLYIAVCGYWFLALPTGLGFAYLGNLGVQGMWFGLACGLSSIAVALLWRYHRLTAIPPHQREMCMKPI